MNYTFLTRHTKGSLIAATLVVAVLMASFFVFEPSVSRSATSQFLVTQEITGETSFLVNAANVTMAGTLSGITGGYATGTTYAIVRTNNPTGYNMTLRFATTTAGHAMSASSTAYINDYTPASAGIPDYDFVANGTGQAGEFAYTVYASTTAELDQTFKDDGAGTCATGSNKTTGKCWLNPTSTPETIMNTSAPSPVSGSTSTIQFRVAVPSNPNPALPTGFYVATGTLTATSNP